MGGKRVETLKVGNMYIRTCNVCGETLPLTHEYFSKKSVDAYGFNTKCKTCSNATAKRNYEDKKVEEVSPERLEVIERLLEPTEGVNPLSLFSTEELLKEILLRVQKV